MRLEEERDMNDILAMRHRVPIVINPAWQYHEQFQYRKNYPRNKEPKYMVMMPKVEVYFNSLQEAQNYIKDSRRIRGQRRRGTKRAREAGLCF
jgi:hypothetical protein